MNSPLISQSQLAEFLEEFQAYAQQQSQVAKTPMFMALTKRFFSHFPLEELVGRRISDVFGSLYQCWDFIQTFEGAAPKIKLFNPSLAEDGWVCPHTALLVLQKDMPFLVDSIRIEMNRRNITVYAIKSTVLNLTRNKQHKLTAIADEDTEAIAREALIFLEISIHTDEEVIADICQNLTTTLSKIEQVVIDFPAMKQAAEAAEKNLKLCKNTNFSENLEESAEFIRWIIANNFTFLGYAEYEFNEVDGKKVLTELVERRLGVFATRKSAAASINVDELNQGMARFHLVPHVITFSKSSVRARIHRYAYSDYIIIKRFNKQGDVVGEARFIGLYTSAVYRTNPMDIPVIRTKVAQVIERTGLSSSSHDGKSFRQIVDTFPPDEIFLSTATQLFVTLTGVSAINERSMVRLFMREDPFGKFVSFVIYVPRDYFSTKVRISIQNLIGGAIGSTDCEFNTYFSESILARVYLVFKVNGGLPKDLDVDRLQTGIVNITRSWEDYLRAALLEVHGEELSSQLLREYQTGFSSLYQERFDARTAVQDMHSVAELIAGKPLAMSIYQPLGAEGTTLQFKLFNRHTTLALSDVIPILENMGFRVISESAFEIKTLSGEVVWLHDFKLLHHMSGGVDLHNIKDNLMQTFFAIWHGFADNDTFNMLVSASSLTWREAMLLRAYASYMHQTLFPFSEAYIANALMNQAEIAGKLIALFELKFNPNKMHEKSNLQIDALRNEIFLQLDAVVNLNDDRIVRRYLTLIDNTLRTNYYQLNEFNQTKDYLSLKFSPRNIPEIPEPRPLFEIFVYSPRVEGVHLRTSKVARGGLRWSDRLQDYRTEVLGLVKAQQVKNAVIVPSGAKGGFVCKKMPVGASREAVQIEGIECYKVFIQGLLDITDNLVDGELAPPKAVVRYDNDDPYLVVAADKGTASFSDIANGISAHYNHWLGDAFASGGSQGYDHKGMGITARGAWISVQRHFKELNVDIQTEPVSVLGIGDMAGDVFGNGMLLSSAIHLVAAFNHMHIFIDPNPDAGNGFNERQRLFNTPKTTWDDYEKALISEGGGVFNRSAKSIPISSQMKACFAIKEDKLTPTELIHALLKSPVDLIWNGGIGTYVKASTESHAEAGDKASDGLRVDGKELRCKVFGEGGNLGMTQRGRIEYCLNGGSCNTDFIDNAAGVDCSDHEVNIKILLNEVVVNGDLTQKQRNKLLVEMTENVAQLVLDNNRSQTLAISVAQSEALERSTEYRRFMGWLEGQNRLNRKLEFLPSDDVLLERQTQGKGLTRPELSVLISYAKAVLKEDLANSDIAQDEYMAGFVKLAFPEKISQLLPAQLGSHRLKREIVATQIANDMVNLMGISFAQRLMESTGANLGDVARAYVIARDTYAASEFFNIITVDEYKIPAELQLELISNMMRNIRRASRWFLRNRRSHLNPQCEVDLFAPGMKKVASSLGDLLSGNTLADWKYKAASLRAAGLPEVFITAAIMPADLYSGLSVIEAARIAGQDIDIVAKVYFAVGNYLSLPWFSEQISELKVENFWQAMARETYMNDLESQLRSITIALIRFVDETNNIDNVIERWSTQHPIHIKRWKSMVNELQAANGTDFAMFSVALRDLLDLSQASQHCESLN